MEPDEILLLGVLVALAVFLMSGGGEGGGNDTDSK
jgi:hypothetical protein